MTDAPRSPVTGEAMVRDARLVEFGYRGRAVTVRMPGWYCPTSGEGVHMGEDLKVSDAALKALKAEAGGP